MGSNGKFAPVERCSFSKGQLGWKDSRGSSVDTGRNSDPGSSCVPLVRIGIALVRS